MFMQILSHTPVFVWAVLAGLVVLGLLQARTRRVPPAMVMALPLTLLGLGLWSMAPGFAALPLVGAAWLGALAVGAALGRRTPQKPGTAWLPAEARFHLPGSWLPMGFILVIFSLRYAVGVGSAMHPDWRADPGVQMPLALVFGLLAGLAIGRAIGLLRLARTNAGTGTGTGTSAGTSAGTSTSMTAGTIASTTANTNARTSATASVQPTMARDA